MQKTFLLLLLLSCTFPAFAQWEALSNWGAAIKGRSISVHKGVFFCATSNGIYSTRTFLSP